MARRASGKAKRASQRGTTAPARPVAPRSEAAAETPVQPVQPSHPLSAEQERDRLKAELAAARTLIAELEQQREHIVNRIDWIIDSLHSLLEDER